MLRQNALLTGDRDQLVHNNGYPSQTNYQPNEILMPNENSEMNKNDDMAFLLFLGGFCLPIIWIVLFFITRNRTKYSSRGRKFGAIGLGLFFCFLACSIVTFIILFVIIYKYGNISVNGHKIN
ncbi:predicted protein [Naegleria gruberi]|uniref:Predicted protein n=1 Tax=Naegleria gruberi TaxID=5762 RepID=D2VRD0_NAEGR|nr:uncharacterized protein NAEGRDRAFT_71542 [Naegleria gruberi]EFC40648.1 predicted protein [Naegleria gruberi]|eukprot:XP_002673392.1 predicted protein [Naegleria gruberi strain NEG-M]